ncbi:glutamine-hydrolyzing carbamoyl-phosphate synthase small subunit [Litorilinea aerophila]|uniref:Carbamoyl phosphate synthase small chain n=1 Tax=Litorilinea aerophila TaxID=1204385 RepID=A0A540VMM8_9CHLR|nr:glutamine-hydrolyzing carbamoyl-phosphate synthase small subunit [Litorilinea aerophila]MCC9074713.1 glutamine-hydrolyzing carbamoyl-phosphate synthase small subunit [Litorilinea aerophila]OUC06339.1 carbamoyl phosphate synthase small subunit [Litorilinea aerophila]GIV75889.1 MAG: carbamoyl-phosphate synthase small chain [Litorilinea sp.]
MNALLVLEDGTIFQGQGFGAATTVVGEVVFNTSLTGYQEVITDPSYRGQMVCMTVSHVGNTGINPEDVESDRPQITAFIVREVSPVVSNWRANETLPDYLARHGIPGISQVDTRALTRRIREKGVLHAALSTDGQHSAEELLAMARSWEGLDGRDLVQEVTCQEPYNWVDGTRSEWTPVPAGKEIADPRHGQASSDAPLVVAYDFGIKHNILRRLTSHGLRVTVVPAHTPASTVLAMKPDGIFLSNGPGDPAAVTYAAQAVKELLESNLPTFGICLGHQIIGLALGGQTYKLKFGHHGSNQPVSDVDSTNVQITAQNHNYALQEEGLPENVEITHRNLNDQTVEGLRLKDKPVFCVQYHPEASPGPHDADLLFARFARLVKEHAGKA